MSDDKMKMATMTSSMSNLAWLCWRKIDGLQKLAAQQKHNDNCQKDVNCGEDHEWHHQARYGCYCLASPHDAVNDPGLPSHFRYHPSGFNRQKSQRTGGNQAAQKPPVIRQK